MDTLFPIENGYEARVIEQCGTFAPDTFSYVTDTLCRVFKVSHCSDCKGSKIFYTYLFPSKGDSIPKFQEVPPILTYQKNCNEDPDCALFETADLWEKPEWYGREFKKGVGKVFSGISEYEECLVEYRIGYKGEVKHYYKLVKTSGVMYYTSPD